MNPKSKWRFAIGTTSRVPQSGAPVHYLIADFDDMKLEDVLCNIECVCESDHLEIKNMILQKTTHGYHLYTDLQCDFEYLHGALKRIKADKSWIRIGKERGYWFLADKAKIDFPYPVEHMVIHYGKKKA